MNCNGDPSQHTFPIQIHVEIAQKLDSNLLRREIQNGVELLLAENYPEIEVGQVIDKFPMPLGDHIESLQLCQDEPGKISRIPLSNCNLIFHVFKLDPNGMAVENLEDENQVHASNHWILPSQEFHTSWEHLIYDSDIKKSLLDYVETALIFTDHKVNSELTSWNKVVLLHGPPGTGKTSLCKALAHKLSVRMSNRYDYGQLIEINSHSLFSKWFSESGKLVQRMFETIEEMLLDPKALVCVLIDEVESLAAARNASGSEPSDSIRVVNALLTQIDSIKRHPNVLILTTSNITGSIDLAFVDRADIKKYIGLPSKAAIYQMLSGSLEDLGAKNLMERTYFIPYAKLMQNKAVEDHKSCKSKLLLEVSESAIGFSGRSIRKLPFLAFAQLLGTRCGDTTTFSAEEMIQSLRSKIQELILDKEQFSADK